MRGYRRRLRVWETDYGREAGWVIECHGLPIAILTDPRWEEMFWVSYRIEIVTDDPELRQRMITKEFWLNSEGLVWRSREFGEVAEFAFPAVSPFPKSGRLTMRVLYLPIGGPWAWDRVVLSIRRWMGWSSAC